MNQKAELLKKFIQEDFGIRGSGRWLRGVRHDSLVLDSEKGIFFWNKEGIYGGPFEYLRFVRKLPESLAKKLTDQNFLGTPISVYPKNTPVVYSKLTDVLWKNGKDSRDYWYKRLLTDDTIDRFQLGYYKGWSTIPVFENGELVQIQKRRDDPKSIFPWYKNIPPKIFNSDVLNFTKTIIFAEGIVDSILLNQFGVPSVSKTIGAEGWHTDWFKLFMKQETIFICFDNDKAGRKGAKLMSKHLGVNRCKIYTFDGFREGYDIIDWFRDFNTLTDLMHLIRDESKYGFQV